MKIIGCTQERIEPGGALMITREALNACGGWATDTVACEEAELVCAAERDGCRTCGNPCSDDFSTRHGARQIEARFPPSFSVRRLGEGQALACAMKAHQARAAWHLPCEREKFTFYLIDWLALLLLDHLNFGPALPMMIE